MTCSLNAPWVINGKKVHWISVLGRVEGVPSISLVSLHDSARVTGMADTGSFPEMEEFVKAIEQELKQDPMQ